MTTPNDDVYVRIVQRITLAIVVIGVLGTIACVIARGWKFGLAFLFGACLSYLSFWRWQKVVEALGGSTRRRFTASMIIRFVVLVAVAYVIIKYLEVNPVAVLLGLLVSAAAVLVSIIFELIYAGT